MQELGIVVALVTAVFAILRWAGTRRRRARRRRSVRLPQPRRGDGSFNAPAWRAARAAGGNFHRPAEIELTKTEILPPPREIEGRYGE